MFDLSRMGIIVELQRCRKDDELYYFIIDIKKRLHANESLSDEEFKAKCKKSYIKIIVTLIISLIPSGQAASVSPVEAIRNS